MTTMLPLDLTPYVNAVGATFDGRRDAGSLNPWGNTFPGEELPFGDDVVVGGTAFRLAAKVHGPDHVEARGQAIPLHALERVDSIALLCCGEMGDRESEVVAARWDGPPVQLEVAAPAWLRPKGHRPAPDEWAFSHLHYPDYELDRLHPVLTCRIVRLPGPVAPAGLQLPFDPFLHVFAVTLLSADGSG